VGAASDTTTLYSRGIAGFHARAERGDHISAVGCFETVARNARENYEQAAPQVGMTVSHAVVERVRI
jgi:aminoglycoside phosphotransferase family enzyme